MQNFQQIFLDATIGENITAIYMMVENHNNLAITPNDEMYQDLLKDYLDIQQMFMHEQVDFKDIIETIANLELEINSSK